MTERTFLFIYLNCGIYEKVVFIGLLVLQLSIDISSAHPHPMLTMQQNI